MPVACCPHCHAAAPYLSRDEGALARCHQCGQWGQLGPVPDARSGGSAVGRGLLGPFVWVAVFVVWLAAGLVALVAYAIQVVINAVHVVTAFFEEVAKALERGQPPEPSSRAEPGPARTTYTPPVTGLPYDGFDNDETETEDDLDDPDEDDECDNDLEDDEFDEEANPHYEKDENDMGPEDYEADGDEDRYPGMDRW